jgi:hypothetical protein
MPDQADEPTPRRQRHPIPATAASAATTTAAGGQLPPSLAPVSTGRSPIVTAA